MSRNGICPPLWRQGHGLDRPQADHLSRAQLLRWPGRRPVSGQEATDILQGIAIILLGIALIGHLVVHIRAKR